MVWARLASSVLVLLSLLLAEALAAPRWQHAPKLNLDRYQRKYGSSTKSLEVSQQLSCGNGTVAAAAAPYTNMWKSLTGPETAELVAWLFAQPSLNLTIADNATDWDNRLVNVEVIHPNKTDALPYMDAGGPLPTKHAKVVIAMSTSEDAYYQDLIVGPLPVQNGTTTFSPLSYPYTNGNAGKVRNLDGSYSDMQAFTTNITSSVADITLDLFGGSATGSDNDTVFVWSNDPYWQDDGRVTSWYTFWNYPTTDMDDGTLLPLGLYFYADITGRDPSQYSLIGWLYNDIFYESTDAFRAAWENPSFEKIPVNVDGIQGSTNQTGEVITEDTITPPQNVAPSGSRFSVDTEQQYVKWMDFEFFISFNRDTGMQLHDVKYKGQRIIYELGLQEALAHYASNDPWQSGISYLDSYYGFGPYAFELVNGYDCPTYSTYLNTSFYTSEKTVTHPNSICLFEHDPAYPIQRHSATSYVSITRNIVFTVRSVCTVGNYDYMFSYEFYMDGSIGVSVRASGYIQSASAAHNDEYGYKITSENLSGSMHDHVLNFKLDLDVLGVNNTMQKLDIVPTTETFAYINKTRNTMKLERSYVASEDESQLFWGPNAQTQYLIVNTDRPNNATGTYPGYRIAPSTGTVHLTVQNSSNLANAAHWAEHDLYVTKQKDTEPRSAHAYNSQDIHTPMVDFSKFFDGDNLTQTDLVVWFNLGMHHVPHTGDLPNTVFTTAQSSVMISPHNYLPTDPSRQTVNMVRIDYGDGETSNVTTFGQAQEVCAASVGMMSVNEALGGYTGDVVVRKFPYDPLDPYFDTSP